MHMQFSRGNIQNGVKCEIKIPGIIVEKSKKVKCESKFPGDIIFKLKKQTFYNSI